MDVSAHWLELDGKVCVVTGAARGIGAAVAREMLEAGARVVLLDRDRQAALKHAEELDPTGRRVAAIGCDVAEDTGVEDAARMVQKVLGSPDILVNNAGIMARGDLETIAIEDWQAQLDVNLNGYLRCAQAFGRPMLARGSGAIVHVASITATNLQAFSGAYSVSKAAVVMLARQLAFEWGPRGVRSNAVSPGMIRTQLTEPFYSAPGVLERREEVVPTRRIGTPQDVARAVAFLASPKANYINGQELLVDGGFAQTLMSHVPRPGY